MESQCYISYLLLEKENQKRLRCSNRALFLLSTFITAHVKNIAKMGADQILHKGMLYSQTKG